MSPEEIKAVGEFIGSLLLGAGGVIATQRLHAKLQPAPSSAGTENSSATLEVVERIEGKVDRIATAVRGVKVEVEALAESDQRHGHEINRLSTGFREVVGRVEALERKTIIPS
jgi:predicted nuclease with TOPRIM domain